MPSWYSPWPVAATLESRLQSAGIDRASEPPETLPNDALVLYYPPDALLIAALGNSALPPSPQELVAGYGRVRSLHGRHTLMAAWRLEAMDPEAIRQWLVESSPIHVDCRFPNPDPLTALLTRSLLESQPGLLEAYLDLELTSELAGGEPDTRYLQRLDAVAADPQALLESWWVPFKERQAFQDDSVQLAARAEALAGENRQALEQMQQLVLADQSKDARLGELQRLIETQTARESALETSLAQITSERDAIASKLDAAMQSAREVEEQDRIRAEALEAEKRLAQEVGERNLRLLHQTQEELERIALLDREKEARIGELQQRIETQSARESALESSLAQITSERDGVARERDAALQQGEVAEREKTEALIALGDLGDQLTAQAEASRAAREAEAQHAARAEVLEGEKQQACEEAERLRLQLNQSQEDLARIALLDQEKEAWIGELQRLIETQTARESALESSLAQITSERDGVARERDAALQTGEVLEGEKQQACEEAERLRLQLNQSREELARIALLEQEKGTRIGELQQRIETQTARESALESSLAQITSERDGVARERDAVRQQWEEVVREKAEALIAARDLSDQLAGQAEVLRLAWEEEAQHVARAEALEQQNQQASEEMEKILGLLHQTQAELERYALFDQVKEAGREELYRKIMKRTVQLTDLQEELDNHFVHSRDVDQLIEAQNAQLKRAHSLMSRLLAQVIRSDHSSPAIAVEVVTPQMAGSQPPSLPGGGVAPDRQGWAGGLLKRVLRQ